MRIPPSDPCCTDELSVRFYTCPDCGFERVPYGASIPFRDGDLDKGGREYEYDAKYCPGCAAPIEWSK